MYWHTPVGLRGPITRARTWWNEPPVEGNTAIVDEEIRADLVERVRREIAEGRYDNAEKWDAALERLLAHMA